MTPALPSNPDPPALPTKESLYHLLARARAGDRTVLPELRQLLAYLEVAAALPNLSGRVRAAWLNVLFGHDLLSRELAAHEVEGLRAALAGAAPTAVERLLVERVAVAWLQVQEADLRLAGATPGPARAGLQREADHANRRFLAAVRSLAEMRRLARPAVQVTVTQQTVTVAGEGERP